MENELLNNMKIQNNFLSKTLKELKETFSIKYLDCRREFSENSVHDLRVATRNLLAFILLIDSLFSSSYSNETKKVLKKFFLIVNIC